MCFYSIRHPTIIYMHFIVLLLAYGALSTFASQSQQPARHNLSNHNSGHKQHLLGPYPPALSPFEPLGTLLVCCGALEYAFLSAAIAFVVRYREHGLLRASSVDLTLLTILATGYLHSARTSQLRIYVIVRVRTRTHTWHCSFLTFWRRLYVKNEYTYVPL